jgi:gas vesicle protein
MEEKNLTSPDSQPLSVDRKKLRPFQPLPVNWQAIKEDYCHKGLSAKDTAKKYGIRTDNIYQRAHREVWPSPKKQVLQRVEKLAKVAVQQKVKSTLAKVEPAIERAVQEWQERTLQHAGRAVMEAAEWLGKGLPPEDLKTVVNTLDTADRVGRRSLGLDKETTGTPGNAVLNVRLELLGLSGSPLGTGPVVDITEEPALLSSPVPPDPGA